MNKTPSLTVVLGISIYLQRYILIKEVDHHAYTPVQPKPLKPHFHLIHVMRKPAFSICENKVADQLCGNCAADHVLL